MSWYDVWPKQRANVTRKRISREEVEYRARVRSNKTKAAVAASNARVADERAQRAAHRAENEARIRRQSRADREAKRRRAKEPIAHGFPHVVKSILDLG